jgi:DNA-repair protein complementing XP-A cells
MANSKGGFLVDDGKEVDEELRKKELQRERERAKQNLEPRTCILSVRYATHIDYGGTAINIALEKNPKCRECESLDLDQTYRKVFGCLVCNKCKTDLPDKYSLLTKTECKDVSTSPSPCCTIFLTKTCFSGLPLDRS